MRSVCVVCISIQASWLQYYDTSLNISVVAAGVGRHTRVVSQGRASRIQAASHKFSAVRWPLPRQCA